MDTKDPIAAIVKTERGLPIRSMDQMIQTSELLARANYLGCKNVGEAFMVLSVCQQRGEDLLAFQQRYHVRQGRISMSAHAILDDFTRRGGTFKVIARSYDRACIVLEKDGNKYKSELKWEDAVNEPFVYKGNEKDQLAVLKMAPEKREAFLKAKYITPRSRMQMLWARVISDGVVVLDPGARMAHTHEETDDIVDSSVSVPVDEVVLDPNEIEIDGSYAADMPELSPEPLDDEFEGDDAPDKASDDDKSPDGDPADDFPEPPNDDEDEIDVNSAPYGEKKGMPWSKMPDNWLNTAMKITDPRMTIGHKKAIEAEIKARKEG
jgi:hypothetical protein